MKGSEDASYVHLLFHSIQREKGNEASNELNQILLTK